MNRKLASAASTVSAATSLAPAAAAKSIRNAMGNNILKKERPSSEELGLQAVILA